MISDEVLALYATVGTFGEIAGKLWSRYGHVVTDAEVSIPVASDTDRNMLTDVLRSLQAGAAEKVSA